MGTSPINVLLVSDHEKDFLIIDKLLVKIKSLKTNLKWVQTFDEGLAEIKSNSSDIYLVSSCEGSINGLRLLSESSHTKSPIIFLTHIESDDLTVKAIKAGATDFLELEHLETSLLERSIRYALERKQAEERILTMAYYDALTGLPNRSLFVDRVKNVLNHAKRYNRLLAIIFIDLDNFKRINDTFGPDKGDELIKKIGDRISSCIRNSDTLGHLDGKRAAPTLARLGGDEFTILLSELREPHDAARVAQRINKALAHPFQLDETEIFITASMGISMYPQDGADVDTLMKNADTAMYYAKHQGKNNYQYYKQAMNAHSFEKLSLETNLRKAIEREEFLLYYQPQIEIFTGKIVGLEALIRWKHPDLGMVSPADFIPLAEETGLIVPIGEWVLRTACMQNKAWQAAGFNPVRVAVNLSIQQFRQDDLATKVFQALSDSELNPTFLELEITESVMAHDVESTIAILNELSSYGISLSLDDFGTGYSSLSYLKRFPISSLKIDRSFVKDVTTDPDDATITKVIIAMAQNFNMKVIAEGVETKEQLEFMHAHDCDEMQGYLISPPVPVEEVSRFLEMEKNAQGIARQICSEIVNLQKNTDRKVASLHTQTSGNLGI